MIKKFLTKVFIYAFLESALYRWVVKKIMPKLRFSTKYAKMDGNDYREAYELLREGDILLSIDYSKAASTFIGGEWAHAAYCVGKGIRGPEVAEMIGSGFNTCAFYDFCKEADRIAIIRCRDWKRSYIKKVTAKVMSFLGTPYDIKFQFESGLKALYCSELVYEGDFNRTLDVNLEDLMGIGREYLSPTGLFKAKNCDLIYITKALT